ncbi:DoxX family protein [Phenylobacterium sp.]|jgi:hypothetical protein|uniref:DoxX family protein n=1 Tax=Phenylobacterium sp. TaxID=1871053 RepID=UPI002F3EA529
MTAQTLAAPAAPSRLTTWAGRGLIGLVTAFMLFDAVIKLVKIQPVTDSFRQLGYPDSLARGIGTMELLVTALYVFPRTSVLGAVLMTAIMGGAIASHLRLGDPLFSHTLFGVYLGLMAWGGLWLTDPKLRALLPLRR